MNTLKFALAFLAYMFASLANAQPMVMSVPWNPVGSYNTAPVYQNTAPYYGNSYGGGASLQYYNQQTQYGGQPLPAVGAVQGGMQVIGYETETRTRQCTPQEEHRRTAGIAATTTFVGGLIGQLRGHNRNSTGQGAGYGLAAGLIGAMVTDCTVEYTVRIPILRPVAVANTGLQQAAYRTEPVTKEVASRCAINGKVWRGLSEAQCDELALELSKTKIVSAQNTALTHDPKPEVKAEESKENNPCPTGRIPLKVTKKGHEYEGRMVCTKPEFRNHPDFQ